MSWQSWEIDGMLHRSKFCSALYWHDSSEMRKWPPPPTYKTGIWANIWIKCDPTCFEIRQTRQFCGHICALHVGLGFQEWFPNSWDLAEFSTGTRSVWRSSAWVAARSGRAPMICSWVSCHLMSAVVRQLYRPWQLPGLPVSPLHEAAHGLGISNLISGPKPTLWCEFLFGLDLVDHCGAIRATISRGVVRQVPRNSGAFRLVHKVHQGPDHMDCLGRTPPSPPEQRPAAANLRLKDCSRIWRSGGPRHSVRMRFLPLCCPCFCLFLVWAWQFLQYSSSCVDGTSSVCFGVHPDALCLDDLDHGIDPIHQICIACLLQARPLWKTRFESLSE